MMKREDMLIEPEELLKIADHTSLRIFDASVSDTQYWQGHIPGAAFFDHERFSDLTGKYMYTLLPDADLAARIGEIGISNHTEVVVYAWGMLPYAARAWWILRYAGHNRVRLFNGGLADWQNAGGMLETETRSYIPAVYEARFRPEMFAGKEAVLDAMDDAEVSTINVLPLASYQAGHITGSVCSPCMDLMQGMDAFLPNDLLVPRLEKETGYQRMITYCGGGIAAAVNAMAYLMLGKDNVAVYDGSMEEWAGEGLPITGNGKWAIWENS
ncbi:MAG: rhodanese-like domain-containing protein [Bellilinea sp.]|jgi:thiosulfate/3-mercaptopyruvate sulfurtransferase